MAGPPRARRLFHRLLRLFPAEFRADFGDQMSADFADQHAEAAGRPRELKRLWYRTVLDVMTRAPREHVDIIRRDSMYAWRTMRRHPVAFSTAILSLAIGIGLNTAVFSVISGVL